MIELLALVLAGSASITQYQDLLLWVVLGSLCGWLIHKVEQGR